MEAVIHQAFGNILYFYTGSHFKRPAIYDHFMRAAPVNAGIQDREMFFQSRLDIVGVKYSIFCGPGQPFPAHHSNEGIRDRQNAGASPGSG
ncbi:hypothetical protein D9M69_617510 [compost metagenome]